VEKECGCSLLLLRHSSISRANLPPSKTTSLHCRERSEGSASTDQSHAACEAVIAKAKFSTNYFVAMPGAAYHEDAWSHDHIKRKKKKNVIHVSSLFEYFSTYILA
jgi:hypothetical protein